MTSYKSSAQKSTNKTPSASVSYDFDFSEKAGNELFGFTLCVEYMRISV